MLFLVKHCSFSLSSLLRRRLTLPVHGLLLLLLVIQMGVGPSHTASLVLQKLVKRGLRAVTLLPYCITSAHLSLWLQKVAGRSQINGSLLA